MDWEFVFISGRWHHLHAEFYGPNGTSIIESVVVEVGGPTNFWGPDTMTACSRGRAGVRKQATERARVKNTRVIGRLSN